MDKGKYFLIYGIVVIILLLIAGFQMNNLNKMLSNSDYINNVKTVDNETSNKNAENHEDTSANIDTSLIGAVDNTNSEDNTEYNVIDNYVDNSGYYKSTYLKLLTSNLKAGKGYVSLSRILYFYNSNSAFTFAEIYDDNLNMATNRQELISVVCQKNKYKGLNVCTQDAIDNSGQIDLPQNKPFIYPTDLSKTTITSLFMEHRSYEQHGAWDLAAPSGTPIYAACTGTITEVSTGYSGGYGNMVRQSCESNGAVYDILYAHMTYGSIRVSNGSTVNQGQVIGAVGSTGSSSGSHLHFEVSTNGTKVDGLSLVEFKR